ncbi:hypothetical protein A7K93_08065 [Candidatus Methylacidiphilum fumarolicum]|uniref:Lipoprotein n=2 Tax=Candidatus Methylacidiphilum fumarolicum TaxID=591154 RepID=I0JWT1_METFB|nr:hypothetical protein [Candidatus Methylacidiphilum fumarolicum]MBW6414396.1 hypothetical protein [Candidatus Methylacidiphilum fumarolicum]TFE69401.1 hypothetical protein A7K73_05560 [Candidatus Methylacidiphilum fumarolicum]TFE72894.1 hypothetical protein A7K93_08065 [Candidatus Methylacidiphilum fumarolicum]TFE74637.1 hypothetical protein A7K72_03995 [Candidatus Methylacidiphilum fumarolicum]TFE77203.1 hypothetical protein A7D33_06515 [Candidatus Methylacidiphilum fumarolicum]
MKSGTIKKQILSLGLALLLPIFIFGGCDQAVYLWQYGSVTGPGKKNARAAFEQDLFNPENSKKLNIVGHQIVVNYVDMPSINPWTSQEEAEVHATIQVKFKNGRIFQQTYDGTIIHTRGKEWHVSPMLIKAIDTQLSAVSRS